MSRSGAPDHFVTTYTQDQDVLMKNPAAKLKMPPTRKPCQRYLTAEEYVKLTANLPEARDRLIVRMFVSLALRPGEMFALRRGDVQPGRLRVDESLNRRIEDGVKDTKTQASDGWVYLPVALEKDLRAWLDSMPGSDAEWLFSTANGTPMLPNNYLRDVIVPAAIRAGIMPKPAKDRKKGAPKRDKATAVNYQAFRRTAATWLRERGNVKDAQAHLGHASPDITAAVYMQAIPESVKAAVESLDSWLNPVADGPVQ
jgi:integrase